ncbi:type VI secretion system contractile sheath small subunit [Klebsiella aerogenes]
MMSSWQSEIPKARINLRLDIHTGGAQKKSELPLKLLLAGNFSNGRETAPLSERSKININKLNMQNVIAELAPSVSFDVKHANGDEETEEKINLTFRNMKDFTPEQVARNIPRLQAMLTMRNLLRDLRANLLDDAGFRRELLNILRNPDLSDELRAEISALAPQDV